MATYWDSVTDEDYGRMLNRHKPLWDYVYRFIRTKNIQSILEIGAGKNPLAREWVSIYKAIDLNDGTDAIHADFTMISTKLFPESDLLLACGVIEHCEGYGRFFEQAHDYNAPWTIISFFNDVRRSKDYIKIGRCGVFNNKYSAVNMNGFLSFMKMDFKWLRLTRRSVVLIIKGK